MTHLIYFVDEKAMKDGSLKMVRTLYTIVTLPEDLSLKAGCSPSPTNILK